MEATDILKKERRAIESVLDSLEKASQAVKGGRQVPAWVFADGLDFIRSFADRCHHGKEEGRLLPLLGERGLPAHSRPIQMMLIEHEEGRKYVRQAAAGYEKWIAGDAEAGAAMADALQSYIELLRGHIYKEDNILYPMGDGLITPEDDRLLVKQFDEVEEKEMGPGLHEKYHEMIEKLEEETGRL